MTTPTYFGDAADAVGLRGRAGRAAKPSLVGWFDTAHDGTVTLGDLEALAAPGFDATRVDTNTDGRVDEAELSAWLRTAAARPPRAHVGEDVAASLFPGIVGPPQGRETPPRIESLTTSVTSSTPSTVVIVLVFATLALAAGIIGRLRVPRAYRRRFTR